MVLFRGASLEVRCLVKVNIISLMKFVNIETKTLNAKFFYNKLTNKNLLWFIDANFFNIHKCMNNEILKQIYTEYLFYKKT